MDGINKTPSEKDQVALQRLEVLRRAQRGNLPIRAVAKQIRMSPKTYRLIETGCQRPQIHTCYQLAGFLGFLPEEVIALVGYPVHER